MHSLSALTMEVLLLLLMASQGIIPGLCTVFLALFSLVLIMVLLI